MRPVIIDTNAYSAFKRNDPSITEVFQHVKVLVLSPIVIGELLAGFNSGKFAEKNRSELHAFMIESRIQIFPITSDTANFYSKIYTSLKNKGAPIPTNDLWIAAQALEHGFCVCTYDRHFTFIDGIIAGNKLAHLNI